MAQASPARVGRTTLLTFVALVCTTTLANGWNPVRDVDAAIVRSLALGLVLLLVVGLPLHNLKLAVLDARALESTRPLRAALVFRWVITLANVILNFFLLALAFFFAAMLINGAAVA
jgi:hypothetical protein